MRLALAKEIIEYCYTLDYKRMLYRYNHSELMSAIRTIENRVSSTDHDRQIADIVYWKIALRPLDKKG